MRGLTPEDRAIANANCPDCNVIIGCNATCAMDATCAVCGRTKHRLGRSEPIDFYGCHDDCPGYRRHPIAPHLWPSEWADHLAGHPREDGAA